MYMFHNKIIDAAGFKLMHVGLRTRELTLHDLKCAMKMYNTLDLFNVQENEETALHLAITGNNGYSPHIIDFIIQNSSP